MKPTCMYPVFVCLIIGLLLVTGCSEVNDDFRMPSAAEIKVHARGFENPDADNFHGTLIRNLNWNWNGCQECHGSAPQFTGGISGVSCATAGCHVDFQGQPKSVAACNTCHGDFNAAANNFPSFAPPRDLNKNTETTAVGVGAHQVHLRGDIMSDGIRCGDCHAVRFQVDSIHVAPTGPDKVVFGELASTPTRLIDMTANPPAYNPHVTIPTCDNTYCHGNFSGGNNFSPVWTVVDGSQSACGTCHGDPETGNPLPTTTLDGGPHVPGVFNCQVCHWRESDNPIARRLADGTYVIENKELHIDGAIYITGERRTDW
jgi:predicted CxxxxCH...CXXCH cytochrome family protein